MTTWTWTVEHFGLPLPPEMKRAAEDLLIGMTPQNVLDALKDQGLFFEVTQAPFENRITFETNRYMITGYKEEE